MTKVWKSEGPEQKYLEKLLHEKKVTCDMKPGNVQKTYPIFDGFSQAVFRKHWGLTKQMFDNNLHRNTQLDIDETSSMSVTTIPELKGHGSLYVPPEKKSKLNFNDVYNEKLTAVTFVRPPVLPCIFTDPETNVEKCLVVLLLFHGVKTINFDLVHSKEGPEPTLTVTYHWPSTMFDMNSMFTKDNEQNMFISKHHPKVMAVEKSLQQFRDNMEDEPLGSIEIQLPVEVQMDPSTWIKTFNKKPDGNVIVFFEFICKRADYIIAKSEKTLQFD